MCFKGEWGTMEEQPSELDLLTSIVTLADIFSDGRLTIYKFSDHWKVMLGNPTTSAIDTEYIAKLPSGSTFYDSLHGFVLYLLEQYKEKPVDYAEYIRSDKWKEKADAAKKHADYKCQLCNSDGKLHAHHRTYERLGDELPEDITVLCAECHAKFHNKGLFHA